MSLDQTIFVTVATLRLTDMDEAKLALLISHEFAHYLMDHQILRLFLGMIREKILSHILPKKNTMDSSSVDPVRKDFIARTKLQQYSCYYPQ